MLIIDRDVRGRRQSGEENEYHFHDYDKLGYDYDDCEADLLRNRRPLHLGAREGDVNATVSTDRELVTDQAAAWHPLEEQLGNGGN